MAKLTPNKIHDRNLEWFGSLPAQERSDTLNHWRRTHEMLVRMEEKAAQKQSVLKEKSSGEK